MRIVVNDIAASSGGALSILKSFYNELVDSKIAKENEWIFLLSGDYIKENDNIKVIILDDVKKSWVKRLKFDFFTGKEFISQLKPDVVFSLQNTITFGLKCPQVLYVHQSIPFQNAKNFSFFKSDERKLAVYQHLIGKIIKKSIIKADKTIVQTRWMRNSVIESVNISPNKIINVFPPMEKHINIASYKEKNQFNKNYFFYPAAKNQYKNHKCIYEACTILDKRGIENYQVSLTIKGYENRKNILQLGTIPYQSVLEKYTTSTLIFPSYIETVGLPLLEARQMGTLILASDCPFSREVLKGYENAYFFDPFKPQQLADLMEAIIKGKVKKKDIRKDFELFSLEKLNNGWQRIIDILISEGNRRI